MKTRPFLSNFATPAEQGEAAARADRASQHAKFLVVAVNPDRGVLFEHEDREVAQTWLDEVRAENPHATFELKKRQPMFCVYERDAEGAPMVDEPWFTEAADATEAGRLYCEERTKRGGRQPLGLKVVECKR